MLSLLQHHLLQDLQIPAQTPPGCWVCLWWEIEEKLLLPAAPGELWKPPVVVFPKAEQLCPSVT